MKVHGGEVHWDEGVLVWTTPPKTPRITGRPWRRLVAAVVERDAGYCWLCGGFGATSADHVVALADGGSNSPDNLRAAHLRCNLQRSARRSTALRAQRRRARRSYIAAATSPPVADLAAPPRPTPRIH